MKNFSKYLLLAFLVENLCTQTTWLRSYTSPVFYAFLALGALMSANPALWSASLRRKFGCFFGLTLLYAFHCFIVGYGFIDTENVVFLIAKVATFFIIMYSLSSNHAFYEHKAIQLFALIASVFILYGLIFARGHNLFNGLERSAFGFVNSNSMGGIATIVFGIILCEHKDKEWNKLSLFLCFIALFAGLSSGSRASIVVMIFIYFTQYKLNRKSLLIVSTLALVTLLVLPKMGIQMSGINRMVDTMSGELGDNRGDERKAVLMMIEDKPWTGWGLSAENQGRAAMLTTMSSHHSYYDLAKTMGIPLAIIWTLIVGLLLFRYWRAYRKGLVPMDFFAAFAYGTLLKGFFEAMFAAVHGLECNMFFVCLAVLSLRLNNIKLCR